MTVKAEPNETSDNNEVIVTDRPPDLIDLTDEVFEDAEVPRHYISWLTDLIQRAKIKPNTMDQRLGDAAVSSDVIVIDDPQENSANKKSTDESQANKVPSNNPTIQFLFILAGNNSNTHFPLPIRTDCSSSSDRCKHACHTH